MEDVYIDFENKEAPAMNDTTLNQLQKLIKQEILQKLQLTFPVGSTYITQQNTNPNTILGFGTWERLKGRVTVGLDEDDTDFNTIGKTGGEKTHTLTIAEMPNHNHYSENNFESSGGSNNWSIRSNAEYYGSPIATTSTGGGQAHNNLQPYKVVGYMWVRTA